MNIETIKALCPEFEYIERTLNRKGPNCFDFHIGKIRDLTTHVHSLLQALAELRAENERLSGQIEELANFIMSSVPGEPSQSQGAVHTAIRVIGNLEAQVAALVEAITIAKDLPSEINPSNYSEDDVINLNDDWIEAYGVLEAALKNTQATAEAYTAKVRREAIEECVALAKPGTFEVQNNGPVISGYFVEKSSMEWLLAESDKKGGD